MIKPDHNAFKPKARLHVIGKRGDDNGPDDPWDTSPKTEAEYIQHMKILAGLQGMENALRKCRPTISSEILVTARNVEPVLEGELPEIDGVRHGWFCFTIACELYGRKIHRALWDGTVEWIHAASPPDARIQAGNGMERAMIELKRYFGAVAMGIDPRGETEQNAGLILSNDLRRR